MSGLVNGADLLTPNLTEASILTDIAYEGQDVDLDYVKRIMASLIGAGAKNVVLKGITHGDGLIRNYIAGVDVELCEVSCELLPYMLHGTGDLYASALLGAIMCDRSLEEAVAFASELVRDAMRITPLQPDFEVRGVSFEGVLSEVTALV
jgi:pyridoxine kinase